MHASLPCNSWEARTLCFSTEPFCKIKIFSTIAWFTAAVTFNVVNNACDCSNRNVVREEKGKNPLICIRNSNNAVNPSAITRKKKKEKGQIWEKKINMKKKKLTKPPLHLINVKDVK